MLFSLYLGMDSKLDFVPFTECIRNVDEKRGVMVQIYGHGAHLSRRNKPRLPKTRYRQTVCIQTISILCSNVFFILVMVI